jgi:hypothetical protein
MWKGLSVFADSPSPIVVVLSGSMEPAFVRRTLSSEQHCAILRLTAHLATGRSALPLESKPLTRNRSRRDCGLQCTRQRHSDRAQSGKKVWSWVSMPCLCVTGGCMAQLTRHPYRPEAKLLTKGDNNVGDDSTMNMPEQKPQVTGRRANVAYSRTLREGTRLSGEEGHYWIRGGIHSVFGLCYDRIVGTSVAEDSDVGSDGSACCPTTRIRVQKVNGKN